MKSIDQIRRENLAILVGAEPSQAAFARKISKDKNQVNQWLGRAGSRNMSGDIAREIERKTGHPAGWMDQDHSSDTQPVKSQSVGINVEKLSDLLETVEAAVTQSKRQVPARTKARLVAALYMDEQASAAGSAQAVQATLASILATLEET